MLFILSGRLGSRAASICLKVRLRGHSPYFPIRRLGAVSTSRNRFTEGVYRRRRETVGGRARRGESLLLYPICGYIDLQQRSSLASTAMTPTENISLRSSVDSPLSCFDEIYAAVPIETPVLVTALGMINLYQTKIQNFESVSWRGDAHRQRSKCDDCHAIDQPERQGTKRYGGKPATGGGDLRSSDGLNGDLSAARNDQRFPRAGIAHARFPAKFSRSGSVDVSIGGL